MSYDIANVLNLIATGIFGLYLISIAGLFMVLRCKHDTVEVIRYHPNVVPTEWQSKQLYVDTYGVINFARCCKCKQVLQGKQQEKLFSTLNEGAT